jgi:hypothetical protein
LLPDLGLFTFFLFTVVSPNALIYEEKLAEEVSWRKHTLLFESFEEE